MLVTASNTLTECRQVFSSLHQVKFVKSEGCQRKVLTMVPNYFMQFVDWEFSSHFTGEGPPLYHSVIQLLEV